MLAEFILLITDRSEPLQQLDVLLNPWPKIATDLFSWNNGNYLIIVLQNGKTGIYLKQRCHNKDEKSVRYTWDLSATYLGQQNSVHFAEDYGFVHTKISVK